MVKTSPKADKDPVPVTGEAMGVVVTKSLAEGKTVLQAASGDWKLRTSQDVDRANNCKYILAIKSAVVIAIFERDGLFTPLASDPARYSVKLKEATDPAVLNTYLGKYYRSYGSELIFF